MGFDRAQRIAETARDRGISVVQAAVAQVLGPQQLRQLGCTEESFAPLRGREAP